MPEPQYVTDEVRALIGAESEEQVACDTVERGSIRRMTQAIMDDDRLYWDDVYADGTRYDGIVAPPLFPVHMFQRAPGALTPTRPFLRLFVTSGRVVTCPRFVGNTPPH